MPGPRAIRNDDDATEAMEHFALYAANVDYHRNHRGRVDRPDPAVLGEAVLRLGLPRAVEVYREAYEALDFVR